MWVSPKKYILTADNEVKEAGPGVSGTVLVGEGSEIPEEEARRYGILNDGKQPSAPLPTNEPRPAVVRDDNPLPKELNFGHVTKKDESVPNLVGSSKPWSAKSEEKKEDKTALSAE